MRRWMGIPVAAVMLTACVTINVYFPAAEAKEAAKEFVEKVIGDEAEAQGGPRSVLEVVEDDIGGTYRGVYTVKFAEAVFVLHCFQKKSKRGIATPKEDMDIIHARLKIAEAYVKELRK